MEGAGERRSTWQSRLGREGGAGGGSDGRTDGRMDGRTDGRQEEERPRRHFSFAKTAPAAAGGAAAHCALPARHPPSPLAAGPPRRRAGTGVMPTDPGPGSAATLSFAWSVETVEARWVRAADRRPAVPGKIDLSRPHGSRSSRAAALAAHDCAAAALLLECCCDPVACVAPVLHHSSRRALRSHSCVPLRGAAAVVRSLICAHRRPRRPDIARPGRAGAPAVNAHPLPSLVSRPVVLELFGRPILPDRPKPSAATRCGHGRVAANGYRDTAVFAGGGADPRQAGPQPAPAPAAGLFRRFVRARRAVRGAARRRNGNGIATARIEEGVARRAPRPRGRGPQLRVCPLLCVRSWSRVWRGRRDGRC